MPPFSPFRSAYGLPGLGLPSSMDQASPAPSPDQLGMMNSMDPETLRPRPQADLYLDHVTVRLLPIADVHLQRTISIRRGDVVGIGRSSHDIAKGLLPEFKNALFDCPVVSRKHAELVWRTEKEKPEIIIVDHGSSHGTFVNGAKLKRGEDFPLTSGDQVRLGCEINSHMGSHDGITFEFVHVEVAPAAPTGRDEGSTRRGFCLYGDEESATGSVVDDDDDSSIIMEEENQHSSNPTTPDAKVNQATARPGSQNLPIDLDQPNLSLRHIIDVDDEVDIACPRPIADLGSGRTAIEIRETQPPTEPEPSFFTSWFTGADKHQEGKNAPPRWANDLSVEQLEEGTTSDVLEGESASDEHEYDDDETSSDMFDGDGNREKNDGGDLASEPYSVDEGPERMSSKKRASPELGSDSRDMGTSLNVGSYSGSGTLHYDPVRGSRPPESSAAALKESMPKPRYTYGTSHSQPYDTPDTDLSLTSRWDVAPPPETTTQFTHHSSALLADYYDVCSFNAPSQSQHYGYSDAAAPVAPLHEQGCSATPQAFDFTMPVTYASVLAANPSSQVPSTLEALQPGTTRNYAQLEVASVVDVAASDTPSKKRKADEMSSGESLADVIDVHTQQDEQSNTTAGALASQNPSSSTAACVFGQPRAKRARTAGKAARSIARAAGKVIGYTALGGLATAYFLQSPVAEALCEWL
nr:isoform 2 of sarcolemmal membrane-associated protein [Quercus suber]